MRETEKFRMRSEHRHPQSTSRDFCHDIVFVLLPMKNTYFLSELLTLDIHRTNDIDEIRLFCFTIDLVR